MHLHLFSTTPTTTSRPSTSQHLPQVTYFFIPPPTTLPPPHLFSQLVIVPKGGHMPISIARIFLLHTMIHHIEVEKVYCFPPHYPTHNSLHHRRHHVSYYQQTLLLELFHYFPIHHHLLHHRHKNQLINLGQPDLLHPHKNKNTKISC